MISRPSIVSEFDNYLTDLVDEMTIKSGEVSDLMSTFNSVLDNQISSEHSIKQDTKATATKFPAVIPAVLNLSKSNKSQLGTLDQRLNAASEETNPNNLIDNVTRTQEQVKGVVDNLNSAIRELKKSAGKAAGYLAAAYSEPTKSMVMSQNASDSESFTAIKTHDTKLTLDNLKGRMQSNMNNLNSTVDSSISQFNNISRNISSTYNGPLSS